MAEVRYRVELTASFAERLAAVEAFPAEADATVYLLSIRHHRQLSFDFARLWPS